MADYFFDEEEEYNENIDVKDDIYNYKGYFIENEEEEEKQFYEFGAHFPYMYLYQRLEIIAQEREQEQKELKNKLKEKEKESRDDPATNEESKPSEHLKDILSTFQQKGKSRNRGDVGIGLTYMPQNKKNNNLNVIDNVGINLIKSTNGQNENRNKINVNVISHKNNLLNNNNNKNCENKTKNICANKNEKGKTKNKITKNSKMPNQKIKIRKRNNNKFLNINNNSLNCNTVSINIFNKNKFGDKMNSKNMTHDIPYVSKIKNNLVNKLKSIQYSKEKLRKQILNTGNIEQRLNKRLKMNIILNKFRNTNNKWSSYSKCY